MFERFADPQYIQWAKDVKSKDGFRCVLCGANKNLESHHLNAWHSFPNERYIILNGICLCQHCHQCFHEIWGKGKNTKFQFEQFAQTYRLFKKIASRKLEQSSSKEDEVSTSET